MELNSLDSSIHVDVDSYNPIPDLSFCSMGYYKVVVTVPASTLIRTSKELGQQLGIMEEGTHSLWHSCPKTGMGTCPELQQTQHMINPCAHI